MEVKMRTAPREGTRTYVRVSDFYVNNELKPVELGRLLWEHRELFLGGEGKSVTAPDALARVVPGRLLRGARVGRLVLQYQQARSRGNGSVDSLEAPVTGDLAIRRKPGAIKILDDSNRRVYTYVPESEAERSKLQERVELHQELAGLPFAPALHEVDLDAGYAAEEFVAGIHPQNFAGCKDDFTDIYRGLLLQFLQARRPQWVEGRGYLESLRRDILSPDGLLYRMPSDQRRTVALFVRDICDNLRSFEGRVPLVLSHGDYFSGNILLSGDRQLAIDWANLGYRTPLHDLYYLYLNHCTRTLDQPNLQRRLGIAADRLRSGLAQDARELHAELEGFLRPSNELRWLFYLECVQVPLVRCASPDDRYIASMLERIGWFREYEEGLRFSADAAPLPPNATLSGATLGSAGADGG